MFIGKSPFLSIILCISCICVMFPSHRAPREYVGATQGPNICPQVEQEGKLHPECRCRQGRARDISPVLMYRHSWSIFTIYYVKLQRPFVCLSVCLSVCLCVCVSVPPFFSTRPLDHNQIWHTYSGRYGTHSQLKKIDPPQGSGIFRGQNLKSSGNFMNCREN